MGQSTKSLILLLAIIGPGCATTNKFAAQNPVNPKQNQNVADSKTAATFLGSPEFSSTNKLKDPIKTRLAYAAWCEQAGNLQEAHVAYQKVLDKSPKNSEALIGMARVERAIGRDAEADMLLRKALKYHPKDQKLLVAIGQVHAAKNQWPEALDNMKAAYQIDPFDKVTEYHLAVVEARTGDIDSATNHFTRSVGQAEAYYNIGYILKEQGKTDLAEKYLTNALRLKPELKQAESTLAAMHPAPTRNQREIQTASFNDQN